ncbi:MAG: OmpA family protein [Polyangiaceae bacterium]|jgi:OOP family OmpA-OmpF porin|nr:OmpA family protein [Polyangiaceae bacterium]
MRKLISLLVPAMVMAAFTVTGCTVKVQSNEPREPKPKKEKPEPKPEAKKRPKINLKALKKVGNELELPAPLPFKTGSAEPDIEGGFDEVMEEVRKYMVANPDVTLLRIEGHTDSDGPDDMNMELSKARATTATMWLVNKSIACKRLMPVGFGEERPLAANDSPENKAKNRRVSFFEATVKNKPVTDDKGKVIPLDNGGKVAVDPCNPAVSK